MNRSSRIRSLCRLMGLGLVGLLSACTNGPPLAVPGTSSPPNSPSPSNSPNSPSAQPGSSVTPQPAPSAPRLQAKAGPQLPPPRSPLTHDELRRQAAERIVAANPERTYLGPAPEVLNAIPVLEIELYGNGSIKNVRVIRYPTQAPESVQIAIDAVKRAAPFGDLHHLPKPWVFTETFLFDDDLHFKPRTLD